MSLLLVVVLPLALTIIGIMLLSRLNRAHDQPEFSLEIDTVDKLAAEREATHHDSHLQRAQILKREKSVCSFALDVGLESSQSVINRDEHRRR